MHVCVAVVCIRDFGFSRLCMWKLYLLESDTEYSYWTKETNNLQFLGKYVYARFDRRSTMKFSMSQIPPAELGVCDMFQINWKCFRTNLLARHYILKTRSTWGNWARRICRHRGSCPHVLAEWCDGIGGGRGADGSDSSISIFQQPNKPWRQVTNSRFRDKRLHLKWVAMTDVFYSWDLVSSRTAAGANFVCFAQLPSM
jgi:hypothetical protein